MKEAIKIIDNILGPDRLHEQVVNFNEKEYTIFKKYSGNLFIAVSSDAVISPLFASMEEITNWIHNQ